MSTPLALSRERFGLGSRRTPSVRVDESVMTTSDSVLQNLSSTVEKQKAKLGGKIAASVLVGLAILTLIIIVIWIAVDFSQGNLCVEPPQTVLYTANQDGTWTSVTTFAKDKSTQLVCRGRGQTVETCQRIARPADVATPVIPLTIGTNPETTPAQVVVTQPIAGTEAAAISTSINPPSNQMATVVVAGIADKPVPVTAMVVQKQVDESVGTATATITPVKTVTETVMTTPAATIVTVQPTEPVAAPVTVPVAPIAAPVAAPVAAPIAVPKCTIDPRNVEQKILDYVDQEYDAPDAACVPNTLVKKVLNESDEDGLFDDEPVCDQEIEYPTVAKILGQYGSGCANGECPSGSTRVSGLENWDAVPCDDNLTMGLTNATLRSRNDVLPVGAENWIDQDSDLTKSNQLKIQQLGGFLPFELPRRTDIEPLDYLPFSYNPYAGTSGPGSSDLFMQDPEQEVAAKEIELGTFRRAIQYGTKDKSRTAQSSNPYAKYNAGCMV